MNAPNALERISYFIDWELHSQAGYQSENVQLSTALETPGFSIATQ